MAHCTQAGVYHLTLVPAKLQLGEERGSQLCRTGDSRAEWCWDSEVMAEQRPWLARPGMDLS